MTVGALGDIVFQVSDDEIKTIRDAVWSGSASISTHQRHLGAPLQEFVGSDADQFEFKVRLSRFLGVEPMEDLSKIAEYEQTGVALPLTIGKISYGRYRWLIKKHKATFEHYDGDGTLLDADVTIALTEYIKG